MPQHRPRHRTIQALVLGAINVAVGVLPAVAER
jgi:hypothetical protein